MLRVQGHEVLMTDWSQQINFLCLIAHVSPHIENFQFSFLLKMFKATRKVRSTLCSYRFLIDFLPASKVCTTFEKKYFLSWTITREFANCFWASRQNFWHIYVNLTKYWHRFIYKSTILAIVMQVRSRCSCERLICMSAFLIWFQIWN